MSVYDFSTPVTQDIVLVPHFGNMPPALSTVKIAMNQSAADAKQVFPIGTELPDTDATNGSYSNPWIIVDYGTMTDSNGVVRESVAILKKYLNTVATNISNDDWYGSSTEFNYLKTTYWNNCSPEAKAAISPVKIKVLSGTSASASIATVDVPVMLPSASNLCLATYHAGVTEGELWEYFGGERTDASLESRKCAPADATASFAQYITRDNGPTGGVSRWCYAGVNSDGAYALISDETHTTTRLRVAAYILGQAVSDSTT